MKAICRPDVARLPPALVLLSLRDGRHRSRDGVAGTAAALGRKRKVATNQPADATSGK
jgi:hypothetical protein